MDNAKAKVLGPRDGKAGVLGALIRVQPKSKLLDSPQTLKFRRVDQADHESTLGRLITQRNYVVDRVAIDSLGQVFGLAKRDSGMRQSITRGEAGIGSTNGPTYTALRYLRNFGLKPKFRICNLRKSARIEGFR